MITLEILDKNGELKIGKNDYETQFRRMQCSSEEFAHLATQFMTFQPGDFIRVSVSSVPCYLMVKLDATLPESMIYVTEKEWVYTPDFSQSGREAMVDTRFQSTRHYFHVRKAHAFEVTNFLNLSYNPYDQKKESGVYPHSFANVETRGDATFFSKNVIDGIYANQSHGSYPYQSWGINQQQEATLSIDFGRKVVVHRIGVTIRADFPHDNYWKQISLKVGDKKQMIPLLKKIEPQYFDIPEIEVEKVTLFQLIKSEEFSSVFPALTQLDVFGRNK